jgi:hypothetical protein
MGGRRPPGLKAMRHRRLVLLLALALAACSRAPAGKGNQPTAAELAKGQHLARPFAPPGRCFGKPSRCISDGQCAPPFSLCQEGTCCSGQIDPVTCECRCGDGPACGPRELCCELPTGSLPAASTSDVESVAQKQPGLRCRPVRECFGGE